MKKTNDVGVYNRARKLHTRIRESKPGSLLQHLKSGVGPGLEPVVIDLGWEDIRRGQDGAEDPRDENG